MTTGHGNTGRTLQLFFIDGRPDGMLTAEVFNWTGHVLKTPRTQLAEALKREQAGYTGVYLLHGEDQDRPRVYVGEADSLSKRIGQHDTQKDWWDSAVLITTAGNSLNKAHVRYLEARLIDEAQSAAIATVENGTRPPLPGLSEPEQANMEEFLSYLFMVLPAIRIDLFQKQTRPAVKRPFVPGEVSPATEVTGTGAGIAVRQDEGENPTFELSAKRDGIYATAILENGELVVQEGSRARSEWSSSPHSYGNLHAHLVESGVLQPYDDSLRVFTQNYAFKSPSAAAGVILGRPANGPSDWRLKDSGKTYRQWEQQQMQSSGTGGAEL